MADLRVPEWLTADFLKSCLQSDQEDREELVITSHTFEPAVPPGNNYGSNMLRAIVNYKTPNNDSSEYSVSLIIKSPMDDFVNTYGEFVNELYDKEPMYYNQFISETYKISKHSIVPKHYSSPNPLCVVLEDLKASGYTMVDRHNLLDLNHCQLYAKSSAKLHALSIAVYKKHPQIIQSIVTRSPEFTEEALKLHVGVVLSSFQCMAAFLEDKPSYKQWMSVINELTDLTLQELLVNDMEASLQPIKALTQRDPWCTNIMFKYNECGQVVDAKLLDFQYAEFTSPMKELITFVWVSSNPEVRNSGINDLCMLYCDSFNKHLEEFGCEEKLSVEDMKADIRALSFHVLMAVCVMLPLFFADERAEFNVFTAPNDLNVPIRESARYKLFQSTSFKKYCPFIFDEMEKEGVLDHIREKLELLRPQNNKTTQNEVS
uniref:CHK kinase-like domain-containing protein n=1 Tax=Homalodisca liturata TaxID=320908 RepID=A0A1B6J1J2_9HEMI